MQDNQALLLKNRFLEFHACVSFYLLQSFYFFYFLKCSKSCINTQAGHAHPSTPRHGMAASDGEEMKVSVAVAGGAEGGEAASCVVCLEAAVVGGEACLYRVAADDERVSARQVLFCVFAHELRL